VAVRLARGLGVDQPRPLGPGLVLVAALTAAAFAVNAAAPEVSALVVAVVLGALVANVVNLPAALGPGTRFAASRLLRLGIVLLGFRLAIGDLLDIGATGLAIVALVVTVTFFGTQWLGRVLGLSPNLSLLVATGYSICGASAVAAMDGVIKADEEEAAYAVALVTLCGTLSILVLPLLSGPLGLSGVAFGSWAGAAVHDVAQVVATAATDSPAALESAVVVKLTRVILLAPMVAGVALWRRSHHRPVAGDAVGRTPVLPLFVVGFLVTVAIRSTETLPADALSRIRTVEGVLLAAALVGLGTGVRIDRLRRLGGRPLVLGLLSWVMVAGISYAGVQLTH
jgi:uncharacterized integral membrane protein (TIGR00698 family)